MLKSLKRYVNIAHAGSADYGKCSGLPEYGPFVRSGSVATRRAADKGGGGGTWSGSRAGRPTADL